MISYTDGSHFNRSSLVELKKKAAELSDAINQAEIAIANLEKLLPGTLGPKQESENKDIVGAAQRHLNDLYGAIGSLIMKMGG